MPEPFLIVKRHLYEEPYHTQLEFYVSNGRFTGWTDIYCNVEQISEIGNGLINFPSKVGDEYIFNYGSEDPKDRFYRFFRLRTYTTDNVGHCAIQFTINLNQEAPKDGICQFSIPADPADINRLGELFVAFASLKHLEFHWSPKEGSLFEQHTSQGA